LSFDEYWAYKRKQVGHPAMLRELFGYDDVQVKAFESEWLSLIEQPEWIAYDQPFEGVTELLRRLHGRYDLFVITARQWEEVALQQLSSYGWDGLFRKVFVTGQKRNKCDLILDVVVTDPADWFIGDTGIDVETGKKLGVRTAAVLSGFRDRAALEPYGADVILDSVLGIEGVLLSS
jgi:phosphoglycolate phosphatase